MLQQPNINLATDFTMATVTTDGAAGIALAQNSPDVTGVAFTTDGTNGQFTLSFVARPTAVYFPFAVQNGVAGSIAPVTLATGSCIFLVSDVATPSVVNLSTTATTLHVLIGPSY